MHVIEHGLIFAAFSVIFLGIFDVLSLYIFVSLNLTIQHQLTSANGKDRDEDDEIFFDGTLEELHDQNINEFVESPPSRASTPSVNTSGYKGRKRQLDNNSTLATILNTAVQSLEEHQKKKQSPHEEDELALFGKKKQSPHEEDELALFGKSIVAELRKVKDAKKLKELKKSI
ncbi:hypothetical protein QE152_g26092 [Popillia japonica]|uniref:Uncharacterized protein n=1 Tax=Popillia japonica TaxID=7064 RepID=A0AAW1JYV1_POPJA